MGAGSRDRKIVIVLRWVGRIWNTGLALLAILQLIGPSNITEPVPWHEWLSPVLLFGSAIAGLILCWRWERAAGLVIVLAFVMAQITACFSRGACLRPAVIAAIALAFATPGVLYLAAWYLSRPARQARLSA